MTCDYCHSATAEGETRCESCGAPLDSDAAPPDYRSCPFCRRRLLALGSPACNHCGRPLPVSYVKAREAIMRRVAEASEGDAESREELEKDSDDGLKSALKALFGLEQKSRRK